MPADTMELAYGVIGVIGADVADITIPGERARLLHLPGADVLLLAGLTVVSAFFRGLLTGIAAGTGGCRSRRAGTSRCPASPLPAGGTGHGGRLVRSR